MYLVVYPAVRIFTSRGPHIDHNLSVFYWCLLKKLSLNQYAARVQEHCIHIHTAYAKLHSYVRSNVQVAYNIEHAHECPFARSLHTRTKAAGW